MYQCCFLRFDKYTVVVSDVDDGKVVEGVIWELYPAAFL